MERTFLLLAAFVFSSGRCSDDDTSSGRSAGLAVCQPDVCALSSQLSAMQQRLEAMTRTQDGLLESIRSLRTEQGVCSTQTLELHKLIQEQAQQLKSLQESVTPAAPRVAFTAVLGHSIGPFNVDTVVKYQQIITNMGSGYNPSTGIFTALGPGMYYFRYTMYNNNAGQANSVVGLTKNGQMIVMTWDTAGGDSNDSATNAAVLQLEAGDSVFVQIYANRKLYDDSGRYNTFSGFLLFPL